MATGALWRMWGTKPTKWITFEMPPVVPATSSDVSFPLPVSALVTSMSVQFQLPSRYLWGLVSPTSQLWLEEFFAAPGQVNTADAAGQCSVVTFPSLHSSLSMGRYVLAVY